MQDYFMESDSLLTAALRERILILDGAMGTMLQGFGFTESDFRGSRFANHCVNLKGDNDVLNLTQPEAVMSVHEKYLAAGADIIETNTFNANAFSQSDYGLDDAALIYELNKAGAAIARIAADRWSTPEKPRFAAGSIGPTGKTLSLSPSVTDPAYRELSFDELSAAYEIAVSGLLDGGADILLIETVFDTLNAKAAIHAIARVKAKRGGKPIPVMISGTVSDASGRLLAGQSVEAFLISVSHAEDLVSIGFNCALGAEEMRPYIEELARKAPCGVSAHPNAGLPDESGQYRQTPEQMGKILRSFAEAGLLNIAGGCCGTNPDHIRAIAAALAGVPPRSRRNSSGMLCLSGLDPLVANPDLPFLNVGERTNVAGSRKFLRLIREGNMEEALRIARSQVENGAAVIDVNMDDAMLDAPAEMSKFLLRLAGEPDIARVPVMIDSSRWEVIRAGLSCVQGKCVINSISLKEGEEIFLHHAREARLFGAALLCMAFDEQGQADTLERRLSICRRMYRLLTEQAHVPPQDIIFDVNVFAVATGMPEHDRYARDFIEAVRILKQEMPLCHFSGGISNVSFSFRGNETVRSALHCVFLYHAIHAGLDMGIVNPAQLAQYEELPETLRTAAEDVILCRRPDAGSRLLELASDYQQEKGCSKPEKTPEWRTEPVERRIAYALIHGDESHLAEDMAEAVQKYENPVRVIEGPLMDGMNEVGVRFGAGKMFLPQVVKTARVMKNAVAQLMPLIQSDRSAPEKRRPVIVLATVKGDVHDIGKNIVGVVLQCNGFHVIDLGVMVPGKTIVDTAEQEHADIIALSGLITPSLEEMGLVADEMERRGMTIPLMVGGAAASEQHTAVKLRPRYPSGIVVYTSDASRCAPVAMQLADPEKRKLFIESLHGKTEEKNVELIPFKEAEAQAQGMETAAPDGKTGIYHYTFSAAEIAPCVNWNAFRAAWQSKDESVVEDAKKMLFGGFPFVIRAVFGLFCAERKNSPDGTVIALSGSGKILPMMRRQEKSGQPLSLADFIAEKNDRIGLFAVSAGKGVAEQAEAYRKQNDDYHALLLQTLAGTVADAAAEYLHHIVKEKIWKHEKGIRPAIGYPVCPDHTLKKDVLELIDPEKFTGISLTENMMMTPAASVCGLMIATGHYFQIGTIGNDQLEYYAQQRNTDPEALKRFLAVEIE